MTDTGLFDVLGALHGMDSPRTYNRGSKTIDYILGTEDIIRAVRRGGMLKFKDGIDSDHRGLWIDICILQAFRGDIHEIHRTQARKVNTKQRKRCQKYRAKYSELAKDNNILEEVQAFQPDDPTQLTQTEEDELNRLNQAVSDSLILSEKSLPTIPTYWWSETLHIRHQLVKYWTLKLSATRIASNVQDTLTKLEIELADTDLIQGDPERSISGQIRKAYKLRREARNNSFKLRQDFLEKLAEEEATRNDNSTKEKILRSMRRSEAQRRMYKILNQYLKPDDRAGITQIDIPVESPDGNEKFKRITIKEEMNEALLPHFRKHFRQAEPTPFNQEPLKSLIGYTAETEFCDKFCQGTADIDGLDVDDDVKIFLHTLAPGPDDPPKVSATLTRAQLMNGFKIWPERTSTSPEGRHLGLYKSWIFKKKEAQPKEDMPKNTFFDIILRLIQIAMLASVPLRRWTTVHNIFIRKDTDNIKINRLRVIHNKLDAELNLIRQEFVTRRIMKNMEKHKKMANEQYGRHSGRCAMDVVLLKEFTIGIFHLKRCNAAIIDCDAKACYDRILPALIALVYFQEAGLALHICSLFARSTLKMMKYFMVTASGVSEECN
eukprot:scaffold186_cov32-Attheya_sp.AAC.2